MASSAASQTFAETKVFVPGSFEITCRMGTEIGERVELTIRRDKPTDRSEMVLPGGDVVTATISIFQTGSYQTMVASGGLATDIHTLTLPPSGMGLLSVVGESGPLTAAGRCLSPGL